jgi:serine/threonine protein kinase
MPSPMSEDHQQVPEAPGKNAHRPDDSLTQEDATRTVDRDETEGGAVIPDSVGNVDIVRLLGRGGMGAVYLGRDRMLSRDVAVKFLLHIVAGEGDPRFEEFLHGARKAAKLRHPNLVTMYHAALTDVGPFLVMEHIDGPTLREILHEHGPLPQRIALRIMKDVATAVSALHEHDVIHRDIKPGNILFDREGHLFVTDFGLACDRPRGTGTGDRRHKVAGSPAYMGPEMFRGEVSTRTDVYAMGVTLYEMLTGTVPFTGEFEEIREKHQHSAPDLQALEERNVPAELIEVIERALHKRELYRFKTAREFARALDQCGVSPASEAELAQYVMIGCKRDSPRQGPTGDSAASDSSSYFDRLAQIASAKQAYRNGAGIPPIELSRRKEDEVIVEIELNCADCGYTLTGTAISDECPECGRPVMRSLERRLLENADPAWLKKVAKGLWEVHTSLWLALGVLIAGSIMFLVAENLAGFDAIAALRRLEPFLAAGAYGLVLAVGVHGAFRITTVEPQFPLAEGILFLNRTVRCASVSARDLSRTAAVRHRLDHRTAAHARGQPCSVIRAAPRFTDARAGTGARASCQRDAHSLYGCPGGACRETALRSGRRRSGPDRQGPCWASAAGGRRRCVVGDRLARQPPKSNRGDHQGCAPTQKPRVSAA